MYAFTCPGKNNNCENIHSALPYHIVEIIFYSVFNCAVKCYFKQCRYVALVLHKRLIIKSIKAIRVPIKIVRVRNRKRLGAGSLFQGDSECGERAARESPGAGVAGNDSAHALSLPPRQQDGRRDEPSTN